MSCFVTSSEHTKEQRWRDREPRPQRWWGEPLHPSAGPHHVALPVAIRSPAPPPSSIPAHHPHILVPRDPLQWEPDFRRPLECPSGAPRCGPMPLHPHTPSAHCNCRGNGPFVTWLECPHAAWSSWESCPHYARDDLSHDFSLEPLWPQGLFLKPQVKTKLPTASLRGQSSSCRISVSEPTSLRRPKGSCTVSSSTWAPCAVQIIAQGHLSMPGPKLSGQ